MAPLMQPFASAPGAEATAIAAAKTAANIHFMTALRILETTESIRSGRGRSGVLRSKATGLGLPSYDAGLHHQRAKDGQPRDEIACGPFELTPLRLGEVVPPFQGPALLDHVSEH